MAAPGAAITQREPTPAKPAAIAAKPAAENVKPTPVAQTTPKPDGQIQTVQVKPGDTASKIAMTNKSASVSLDQMLVALLRANPDAFIQDNVNRIKAGAILTVPNQDQASAIAPVDATQLIVAQSQDFNDFRRKFAGNAPTAKVAPASRDVSGKIQATVEDKKPAAATADKLTLSKGTVQGKSSEDELAKARNAEKAANRAEELAKNLKALDQLASAASAPAAAPLPAVAPASSVTVATPASSVPAAAPASAEQTIASAPKKLAPAPTVPVPAPESSFIDDLMANPMLPVGAAALVALLIGLGVYKTRQRKKAEELDSTFANSDLAFSGASGGQNVDTSDSLATGSSMVYSPSQLDAVDDVDPVAEADVYLAYGRDLQAEEILKDALRTRPQRVAIHQKLLEIYAKRHDVKAFESIAALAFNLTDGTGTEWEQICEKGLAIDPDNALYLPGGQPLPSQLSEFDKTQPTDLPSSKDNLDVDDEEVSDHAPIVTGHGDLDLDLDFSLDDAEVEPEPAAPAESPHNDAVPTAFSGLGDFAPTDVATMSPAAHEEPLGESVEEPTEPITTRAALADNLDFMMPSLDLEKPPADNESASAHQPSEPAASTPDDELMSFDLGSLSLDLGEDKVTVAGDFVDEAMDPLETKLALADEFRAIGDDDGARALIEEVLAEAAGDLRSKAQNALAKL
jgi:pilus assembly protein FimV